MSVITSKNDLFHNDTIFERGRFFITIITYDRIVFKAVDHGMS